MTKTTRPQYASEQPPAPLKPETTDRSGEKSVPALPRGVTGPAPKR